MVTVISRRKLVVAVVGALALGAAGVVSVAAAANPSTTVDDGTTSGTNRFAYSGSWVNCGGCSPSGAYKNGFRYAYTAGASVTFTFVGTQAVVTGLREPAGGIASVSVDGGAATDVDFRAAAQSYAAVVTTPVLASGTHTVTLTVSGRTSGSSKTISVDKADVYTDGGTTPTSSSTTSSSTTTSSSSTTTSSSSTTTSSSSTTTSSSTTSSTTSTPTTTSTPPTGGSGVPSATVDDGTTSGTNRFTYSGSWVNCGGCSPSGAYKNGFRYAYTAGASVTFTFVGTQAVVTGLREPAGGIASVSVDGGAAVDVDFRAAAQSYAAVVTTPVLASGTHTVTLTVSGRTSGSSKTISVDKADVYTDGGTTPTSSSTTTSSSSTTTSSSTTPPTPGSGGVASLTFDDGQIGQYNNARPALNSAGLHGTFFVISDGLGWGTKTNMSPTEAKQLVAEGHEIGNHTRDHSDLTSLSSSQVTAEFADSQAAIQKQVGVTPTSCAYPYGTSNATVQSIAAKYFTACRGTGSGTNKPGSLAAYNLAVYYMGSSTTASDVSAAVRSAIANKVWVIFVWHGVGTGGTSEDVTTSGFQEQVRAIKDSGIPVRTVSEAMASMGR